MDLLQTVRQVLTQFANLDWPSSVLDQIKHVAVDGIEAKSFGLLADLHSDSHAIYEDKSGETRTAFIDELVYEEEQMGDVILHFQNGRLNIWR